VAEEPSRLAEAERYLEQARRILMHPVNLDADEWVLLATLVGEADHVVREEQRWNPQLQLPLLDEVIDDFRELTADFTNAAFLSATRAARRRNPPLFTGRPK
jgi:hypothetical protein